MPSDRGVNPTAPNAAQVEVITAYLPALEALEGRDTARWQCPAQNAAGAITAPFPVNADLVCRFMGELEQSCLMDADYDPRQCERNLTPEYISAASLDQLRELLTYFVRGERFCDGWWASMVRDGHVQQALRRLNELKPAV